jgi:hypothetical protein
MKHAIHPYIYTIILIVSALLPTTLQAQTAKFRVHGQINDAETKEALPYISVKRGWTETFCQWLCHTFAFIAFTALHTGARLQQYSFIITKIS